MFWVLSEVELGSTCCSVHSTLFGGFNLRIDSENRLETSQAFFAHMLVFDHF